MFMTGYDPHKIQFEYHKVTRVSVSRGLCSQLKTEKKTTQNVKKTEKTTSQNAKKRELLQMLKN